VGKHIVQYQPDHRSVLCKHSDENPKKSSLRVTFKWQQGLSKQQIIRDVGKRKIHKDKGGYSIEQIRFSSSSSS